jgi:DNA-binding transcriptional LysR family regulator
MQHSLQVAPAHRGALSSRYCWAEFRVFLAVAKARSFNGAAELLNMSQPTVSRRVKRLQDVLGSQLLSITRQGVTLTRSGEELAHGLARLDDEFFSLTISARRAFGADAPSADQTSKTFATETTFVPDHIRERAAELAALARRADLQALAELLELTSTEAAQASVRAREPHRPA